MQIYGLIIWMEGSKQKERYPARLRWPNRKCDFHPLNRFFLAPKHGIILLHRDRSIDRSCFQCDKEGYPWTRTALILTRDPIKPGYYNYSFTGSIIISWMNASLIMTSHARFIDKYETSIPFSSTLERRGNDQVVLARRISIRFLSTPFFNPASGVCYLDPLHSLIFLHIWGKKNLNILTVALLVDSKWFHARINVYKMFIFHVSLRAKKENSLFRAIF